MNRSEKKLAYDIAFIRSKCVKKTVLLHKDRDSDILNHLAVKSANFNAYIKGLIRKEIEGERNMKKYKVKPEFFDLWGEETTEGTILTEKDVEEIARGWDKTVDDVIDQLIPVES